MADTPQLEADLFFSAARMLEIACVEVRVPSPLDGLLLSLLHGRKADHGNALRWVVDAMTQINAAAPDWSALLTRATQTRTLAACAPAIDYLRRNYDLPIPELPPLAAIPWSARSYERLVLQTARMARRGARMDPIRPLRSLLTHVLLHHLTERSHGRWPTPASIARHMHAAWADRVRQRQPAPMPERSVVPDLT